MNNRQMYKGKIELAFDNNGRREVIPSEKIIYIMIEHDYETRELPIIYITMSVNNSLYTSIIRYKDTAKFYLRIDKENVNSRSSLSKKSVSGLFNYIPSDVNPNYTETLNEPTSSLDNSYKKIMIGLISIDLINYLRKSFNGIYNNINQSTLISLALEGHKKMVIEKPSYDKIYESLLINPISSRKQMLDFIFNKDPFYDTMFRFFVDFDTVYLTSKRGDPIESGNGQLNNVNIDIKEITADESYYEGVAIKDGSYYINMHPSNSNVFLNQGTEKVANQIVAVDDDTAVQVLDLNINNTIGSQTKQMFIRSENATLYKNEMETDTVLIEVVKQNIDGSFFTPDKTINISNYGDYRRYNGRYLLLNKKEFYKCVAGEFVISCVLSLKKIGNIEPINVVANTPVSKRTVVRSSARKTTTANSKNTSTIKNTV